MASPLFPVLRRACYLAPLLLVVGCPVDQDRGLSYGVGVSSGSASSLTEAGEGGGGAVAGVGSGGATMGGTPENTAQGGAAGQEERGQAGESASGGSTAPTAGSSNAGGGSTSGSGGAGGSSSTGGTALAGAAGSGGKPDDGVCGDLDQNNVQDCQETLAKNSTFDANADGWVADPGISKVWQAADARGKSSGSMRLDFATTSASSSWVLAAAGQCLPAWSDDELEVGARSFIPDGQAGGRAEVSLAIFTEDDCHGGFLDSLVPVQSSETGSWQALHGSVKMPAGTRSVLVRLAASKPGSQASLQVQFDDILIRKK